MINIFIVIFCFALSLAFFDPYFFIGYLIGIAFFGLFQAIFMANAGGAWDNAKKIVEVELKQKGTPLHAATVVGDTVGDPFKDTSSVSLNPVIKFTTLFGLLAVEIENRAMDKSDAACAEFEHEVARALWTVEDNLRCEVDEALERLRNGTYGYCECTGRPISLRRLHAVPWARYCSEVESGLELARSRSREEFSRDRRLTRD
jgi:RNA polymerase-binding transcription factor DksA